MRKFNVTAHCIAKKHYMVDISKKLEKIKQLVDNGYYFTINRARQYGKTTTLSLLEKILYEEYIVASISFQGIGNMPFENETNFCNEFKDMLAKAFQFSKLEKSDIEEWISVETNAFRQLSMAITEFCKDKNIILIIDEVDKASDNRIFIEFLGMLRDKYIECGKEKDFTFHSVVLAGVHDIKNIKNKLIKDGKIVVGENEVSYNSPWNIAVDFDVDMSFNPEEITTMLEQYQEEHGMNMDVSLIADRIFHYTNGYPYLVSRICQHIDEKLDKDWTVDGVQNAVNIIIKEDNTLFDDLVKNMENNQELYDLLQDMLFTDYVSPTSIRTPEIQLGLMFGILTKKDKQLSVSNIIFETIIYDYIVQKNRAKFREKTNIYYYNPFIVDGQLDMPLVMKKFGEFMYEEFREADMKFIERNGRLVFLSFLKPIINGKGLTFVETQTRQNKQMDIIVVYESQSFLIELKIWYGSAKHNDAYGQLLDYMDIKRFDEGYLLTFDFRKEGNKTTKAEWIEIEGKKIFDVIV